MATPIQIAIGDSLELEATITLGGAGAVDGAQVRFTLKRSSADPDEDALIRKDTGGNGITVVDAAAGRVRITLLPADTLTLPPKAVLKFDIKLQPADPTKSYIVYEGSLQARMPITRRNTQI